MTFARSPVHRVIDMYMIVFTMTWLTVMFCRASALLGNIAARQRFPGPLCSPQPISTVSLRPFSGATSQQRSDLDEKVRLTESCVKVSSDCPPPTAFVLSEQLSFEQRIFYCVSREIRAIRKGVSYINFLVLIDMARGLN